MILKNKAFKTYDSLSRYSPFAYWYNTLDEKYIYETTSNLRDDTPYEIYITKKGQTLDDLALYAYNDPCKYWVIADYNRIQDPVIFFKDGEQIKIPNISTIEYIG